MISNFDDFVQGLRMELREAMRRFDDSNKQETADLIRQAIRAYSRDRPRILTATIPDLVNTKIVNMPQDAIAVKSAQVTGGRMMRTTWLDYQWQSGIFATGGDYNQDFDQAVLVFSTEFTGSLDVVYYGMHDDRGESMRPSDVEDCKHKLYELAIRGIISTLLDAGTIHAGPLRMDVWREVDAWKAKAAVYLSQYQTRVQKRPYGTFTGQPLIQTKSVVWLTSGEVLA